MSKTSLKPIGQVLQEAGLVSATQVEIALQEQTALCGHPQAHVLQGAPHFPGGDLQETAGAGERMTQFNQTRLGEILARRGWLKQETADFFAEQWPTLLSQTKQPLGQYFKEAALLNKVQIEAILSEQRQTGLKFGELAVQKGWLKRITLDFFLNYLAPTQLPERQERQTEIDISTLPEPLKEIRQRLLNNRQCAPLQLLKLYQQILRQGVFPANDTPEQVELLNLGLITQQENQLRISNPIYETVFNLRWVEQELGRLRPFNQIRLKLFKLEEKASSPYSVLEEINSWTGEQFLLTQKLCQLIAESKLFIPAGEEAVWVERLVRDRLIKNWETGVAAEPLRVMRQRLLYNQRCDPCHLLELYQQILQEAVPLEETPEQMELLNLGLVVKQGDTLKVANSIYEEVFNLGWVTQELEKRRRDSKKSKTAHNVLNRTVSGAGLAKARKAIAKPVDRMVKSVGFGLGIAGAIVLGLWGARYFTAQALFNQGNELFNQGDYQRAIAKYDELLQIDSNYYQAWTNRGYALAGLQEYSQMKQSCLAATVIQPQAVYAWNCQGEALHNLKQYEEAIASFDQAIALDAKNPVFWINKTESLLAIEQTNGALAVIDEAIKLLVPMQEVSGGMSRELSVAFSNKGRALSQKQEYEEALNAYEQALAYEPNYFAAQRGRGIALGQLQQTNEAIAQFEQMLDRPQLTKAQKAETCYYLGRAFYDSAQIQAAIAAFDEALKLKPDYQAAEEAKRIAANKL